MYVCMYVCIQLFVTSHSSILTQRNRYHYECKWENLMKNTQRTEEKNAD